MAVENTTLLQGQTSLYEAAKTTGAHPPAGRMGPQHATHGTNNEDVNTMMMNENYSWRIDGGSVA